MAKQEKDPEREERIHEEILVDTYNDPQEKAMGWYYTLQDKIVFPFNAECIAKRAKSPLKVGDKVKVTGMPAEDECLQEMYVMIRRGKDELAVPLAQLRPTGADEATVEAVEDWHYWVAMGYQF